MLTGLLQAARLSEPTQVAGLLADQGEALGARGVIIYLIDHEQVTLVPLQREGAAVQEPLPVASTLAGRCFQDLRLLEADQGRQVWVPLLDGLERLGVVQLEFADLGDRAEDEQLHQFGALIAEIVMVKQAYGDLFHITRRRQPMSLAAEIAWTLLPPLTFGTDRLVISCVLAPAYAVGGDSFDYAVDGDRARLALFDAMGHGLNAGLLATVAVGAYRNSRRHGLELPDTVKAIDAAIGTAFGPERFVTAVLVDLNVRSGRLSWHSAGHPAPLLLRGGRVIKALDVEPGLPLGLGGDVEPTQEQLEPGDRLLLYTDGVVEARSASGEFFGVSRLVDIVRRQEADRRPVPETMRRVMLAILDHQAGELQDDATAMLVEWRGRSAQDITPEQ
jgi:serine phosphatase RsbU (regulator of sigma subunit)